VKLSSEHVHRAHHTLVRYEELVSNPEATLTRLCRFMGVEFEAQMLENYASAAERLTRTEEVWKVSAKEPVHNANGTKFGALFDEDQRRHILGRLMPLPAHMRSTSRAAGETPAPRKTA